MEINFIRIIFLMSYFSSLCPGGKQRGPVQTRPEAEERSPGNISLSLVKILASYWSML